MGEFKGTCNNHWIILDITEEEGAIDYRSEKSLCGEGEKYSALKHTNKQSVALTYIRNELMKGSYSELMGR